MKSENMRMILDDFSSEITTIYRYLREERKEFRLSGQLINHCLRMDQTLQDSISEEIIQSALTNLNAILRLLNQLYTSEYLPESHYQTAYDSGMNLSLLFTDYLKSQLLNKSAIKEADQYNSKGKNRSTQYRESYPNTKEEIQKQGQTRTYDSYYVEQNEQDKNARQRNIHNTYGDARRQYNYSHNKETKRKKIRHPIFTVVVLYFFIAAVVGFISNGASTSRNHTTVPSRTSTPNTIISLPSIEPTTEPSAVSINKDTEKDTIKNTHENSDLTIDGISDVKTQPSLFSAKSATNEPRQSTEPTKISITVLPKNTPIEDGTLASGSKGENVKRLTQKLIVLGFESGFARTYYDRTTEMAVKRFQKSVGLPITGIADEETQKALYSYSGQESNDQEPTDISKEINNPVVSPSKSPLEEYTERGISVIKVPADVLYEYGSAYVGTIVVTSITVKEKSDDMLKADTSNNDTYSFSIVAKFKNKKEIEHVNKNSKVIISGKVDEMGVIDILGAGKTVNLIECQIINDGISDSEIEQARDDAIKFANDSIKFAAQAKAKADKEEREAYMNKCESVSYSDVERNPNQYKGKLIKVTGTVEQVSEGWFNSITMRVDQGGGKMWYVTYYRANDDEPRILERDKLTLYGECDGVETYKSIIGSSITIPALKAKMYE